MEADDTHDDVGDHPYSAKMADVELTQTSETNTNFKPVDWNAVPFVEDDSVYEDETSMSQDYEMDVDKDTVTDETQVQQNEDWTIKYQFPSCLIAFMLSLTYHDFIPATYVFLLQHLTGHFH